MRNSVKVMLAASAAACFVAFAWDVSGAYSTYLEGLYEYQGIRIVDGMPEVRYALGTPQFVLGKPPSADPKFAELPPGALWVMSTEPGSPDVQNRMPGGTTIDDDLFWEYGSDERYVRATFDPATKLVREVTCHTPPGGTEFVSRCAPLFGLYATAEERFTERFGDPTSSQIDAGSGTKDMVWDGLGLRITLIQRKAYSARKLAPSGGGFIEFLTTRYF